MTSNANRPHSIMFSHNDLDGVGCGIVHKDKYGEGAETHYCGYYNVDEVIQERITELNEAGNRPSIIISDLGINKETAKMVNEYTGDKILLDHHKTNEWLSDTYEWAYIDTTKCGTVQVFQHLQETPSQRFLDMFVLIVDDYDRWVHQFEESIKMNRLFYVLGIERFEQRTLNASHPHKFDHVDETVLDIEEDRINKYINGIERNTKVFTGQDDKRFGIVFADQYHSETAHEVMESLELDMIALIDANRRKISLRSMDNVDVGTIAKNLGGGGHKNASGFSINYEQYEIKSNYVGSYPMLATCIGLENAVNETFTDISHEHYVIETEQMATMFGEGGRK